MYVNTLYNATQREVSGSVKYDVLSKCRKLGLDVNIFFTAYINIVKINLAAQVVASEVLVIKFVQESNSSRARALVKLQGHEIC